MTTEIKDWLEAIHLHQYFSIFIENGYRTIQECVYLTESDLDDLGITLPGHRRRILANIPYSQAGYKKPSYPNLRNSTAQADDLQLPPPSGRGHRGSITSTYLSMSGSRNNSASDIGDEDSEQIYDVPPVRVAKGHRNSTFSMRQDEDIYVKPDTDVAPGAPPLLPKKKGSLDHIDVKLGISPRRDDIKSPENADDLYGSLRLSQRSSSSSSESGSLRKRPIPKPRGSVQKKPVPMPRSRKSQTSITSNQSHSEIETAETYEEIESPSRKHVEVKADMGDLELYEPVELNTDMGQTQLKQRIADNEMKAFELNIYEDPIDIHATSMTGELPARRPPSDGAEYEMKRPSDVYELQGAMLLPEFEHVEYELETFPQRTVSISDSRSVDQALSTDSMPNCNITPNATVTITETVPTTHDLVQLELQVPEFSERVVVGAELTDLSKEEEENLLNESLYQETSVKKLKPTDYDGRSSYHGVWEMKTGSNSAIQLPLPRRDMGSFQSSEGDRESTASFDEPPPAFTPPPLPPHYSQQREISPSLSELPSPPAPPTPAVVSTSRDDKPTIPHIPARPSGGASKYRPPLPSPLSNTASIAASNTDNSVLGFRNEPTPLSDDLTAIKAAAQNIETAVCGAVGGTTDPPLPCGNVLQHLSSLESRASVNNEQNVYSPTTFPFPPKFPDKQTSAVEQDDATRRQAPSPPPKKDNPFKDIFDASSGTYCLQGFYDAEAPMKSSGWESEDTLSDGGDFHDDGSTSTPDPSSLTRKSSIPIVQVSKTRKLERSGYLYKKSSGKSAGNPIKSSFRWQKRWVVFDSVDLKYYFTNKTHISKRIVPGITIKNVDQEIKQGETHPFRFNITTIDRVYTFATDDLDDLSLWTSLIMQTVLESQTEDFPEGGEMNRPDKEGFVKMEGAKGKRYVVVKKAKMCYYNTYNDFQAASPIHMLEMKLASVKEVPRNKTQLQLITPYASYLLVWDTQEECISWKEIFEEAIADGLGDDSVLKDVYENHSNRMCADCGAPDPHWASINLVITICKNCAGIHRSMAVQTSKVRSLRMDFKVWSISLIELFKLVGNDNANNFWEWNSTEEDRVDSDSDMAQRRKYICDKYKRKKYCNFHPLREDQAALNEALCKFARYDDVLETMQLVFSGADVLHISTRYGSQEETPLSLAKGANKTMQMEFLYQNGAEGSGNLPPPSQARTHHPASVLLHACSISYRGYLYKTGSNFKSEFLKRYVVLEHDILSYFETEQSRQAKDSIEKCDMLSVAATTDDRFEFTFELATIKSNGRIYLFASDTLAERQRWVNYIAKTITTVPEVLQEDLENVDRGGIVFLRDGASAEYQKCWMHVKKRKLFVFIQEANRFEDIDLLKIKSLKMLNSTVDSCSRVLEQGAPFVIDLKNRALYIQADLKKETEEWHRHIRKAALEGGSTLGEQQLTGEDIPVIVDKCINFIETHALETEGIYRLNGQHMKVTKLLDDFCKDALSVHLRLETTNVIHDVCTALKRFFRNLDDPLLTEELHSRWIATALMQDQPIKLKCYEDLLVLLPKVNYATLRKLVLHLVKVTSHQDINKMGSTNLASIFGPILVNADKPGDESPRGFGGTNQEIAVLKDLIDHQTKLFEVKTIDMKKEQAIKAAMEKIMQLKTSPQNQGHSGDLLIAIYVNEKCDDNCVTLTVNKSMTALQVQQKVLNMRKDLSNHGNWGLFEVICGGDLQRPVHYNDQVQEISLNWSFWPQEFARDNHFCLKDNFVYKQIEVVCDSHFSLFGELRFSEKRGFKRYSFEFSQSKLIYTKEKANIQLGSWNVEDLVIYLGCQAARRGREHKHIFTFIAKDVKEILKTKDSPYFGHSVCCHNEEELYRWIAAMLRAQHPEGLIASSAEAAAANMPSEVELSTLVPAGAKRDRHKSVFHKLFDKTKR